MAKAYDVPGLPEALGIAISVKEAQRLVGGDGAPIVYDVICITVRNTGAEPVRVTFTVEGRHRDTGEVKKVRTFHHGKWSEMRPGAKRGKDIDPGNLNWFLVSVEVERGGRSQRHRLEHRIAHREGSGCFPKLVVPTVLFLFGSMLAGYWWG